MNDQKTRTSQASAETVPAYLGTTIGEDAPYTTDEQPTTRRATGTPQQPVTLRANRKPPLSTADVEQTDDAIYQAPRFPNSTRRYRSTSPTQTPTRAVTPIRKPMPTTRVQLEPVLSVKTFQRFLLACLCVIVAAILIAVLAVAYILPAFQRWQETNTYGYPRITRAEANVGHGTKAHPKSRFIGINNGGILEVIEMSEDEPTAQNTHIYVVAHLASDGIDPTTMPIRSITFPDLNGDGKPDMMVVVNDTTYEFINDGTTFKLK